MMELRMKTKTAERRMGSQSAASAVMTISFTAHCSPRFPFTIGEESTEERETMQLGKWNVDVDGQDYAVTVDRGENGKDVVRINGRVAAKPMGAEENDRSINIGGSPYVLQRLSADKYDLHPGEASMTVKSPLALAREIRERDEAIDAMSVLAGSNAPVALQRDSFFKRLPIFGWVFIVAAVGLMMYVLTGPSYDKIARERVIRVLSEMHAEKSSQFAVTFWFKNKKILDNSEMSI